MTRLTPLLLVGLLVFLAACLGAGLEKMEMTVETGFADVTGTLNTSEVTASEFMEMFAGGEDFVLIDVRSKEEYDSGHIPGAVHIPYTEIDNRIGELGLSKDDKIVVYCEAGVRSKKGATALLKEGYTNIVDVTDGMRGWRAIGGEIIVPGAVVEQPAHNLSSLSIPLISSAELSKGIDSYKVVFLGTKNQYDEGHVPGALHVNPLKDLFDPDGAVPHMVLGKEDFESFMSGLGIAPEDQIVIYDDQPEHKYGTRLFWILSYYGHDRAAVLDGGLSAWRDFGGELTTVEPEIQPAVYKAGAVRKDIIATLGYVNQNLQNPGVVIVDATTREEYETEGHIPGAVLIEPEMTLNSDGTIKDEEELSQIFTSRGVTRDKEVITYCHTGHRGSVLWFELKHLLNYPRVRLFDGSLEEWNANSMPLETGTSATTTTTWITPSTTWTTTTTTPPPAAEQKYLTREPDLILDGFKGSKAVDLKMYSLIRIDDSYIYLTDEKDGCLGLYIWQFNIYRDTEKGALYEGTSSFINTEIETPQDVSNNIHKVSSALDDYRIEVVKWRSEGSRAGADLKISR